MKRKVQHCTTLPFLSETKNSGIAKTGNGPERNADHIQKDELLDEGVVAVRDRGFLDSFASPDDVR